MSPLLVALAVWSLLVSASLLAPRVGGDVAALAAQAAAVLLLLATRARPRPGERRPRRYARSTAGAPRRTRRPRTGLLPCALALAAGFAGYPACLAAMGMLGTMLGLAPGRTAPPWSGGPLTWAALLAAA